MCKRNGASFQSPCFGGTTRCIVHRGAIIVHPGVIIVHPRCQSKITKFTYGPYIQVGYLPYSQQLGRYLWSHTYLGTPIHSQLGTYGQVHLWPIYRLGTYPIHSSQVGTYGRTHTLVTPIHSQLGTYGRTHRHPSQSS